MPEREHEVAYGGGWVYTLPTKYQGDPPVAGFGLKRTLVALVNRNIQIACIFQLPKYKSEPWDVNGCVFSRALRCGNGLWCC